MTNKGRTMVMPPALPLTPGMWQLTSASQMHMGPRRKCLMAEVLQELDSVLMPSINAPSQSSNIDVITSQ